ncbi:hypothetical protein M758_1G011600 [Ceratodon purpureus]|uniref:Uncharacterized protein n=1 Tax=Ceratodon purpureus TaxID=3225 RepID=A0A8T0J198_CERPU|nr:hypothetical protein KC19_1G012500 [Ceratodon purpureus]KAG0628236.1 hypothetical protein M758_1G011600 [Ceratodon purpureus]
MTNFHRSMSPGPGTIKDVHHQFKTNQKAQGTGPGTYDSFWNVYIYGTRFNPELDDTPGPTTYSPKLPPNMPKYSIARRLTTPFYDVNPPPPKYRLYPTYHIRSSVLVGEICSMRPEQTRECEACQHFIRIYRQRDRRTSMEKKLNAQMKYPSKPKRIPVFKLKLEDAREERRNVRLLQHNRKF